MKRRKTFFVLVFFRCCIVAFLLAVLLVSLLLVALIMFLRHFYSGSRRMGDVHVYVTIESSLPDLRGLHAIIASSQCYFTSLLSAFIVSIQHLATELEKAPPLPTHPLLLNDIVGFPMDTVEFGYGIFKF